MIPEPIHDVEALAALNYFSQYPVTKSQGRRWLLAAPICVVLLFLSGFFIFINNLSSKEITVIQKADAIVALTGGSDRIADAVDLLAEGRAKRLLISGVNLATSTERLAQINPKHRDFFACCIDIDYAARNTVGNAIETRRWVDERGIQSLIVVTSNYHMPRAMIELKRALPKVILIAYPTIAERGADDGIIRDMTNMKIMGIEYTKFLVAYTRASLLPTLTMTAATIPLARPETTGSLMTTHHKF